MTELDPQAPGLVSFLLNDRFQIEHRTVLGDLQNGLKEMMVSGSRSETPDSAGSRDDYEEEGPWAFPVRRR